MKLLLLGVAFFDLAFIGEESAMANASGDVIQSKTVTNNVAVSGGLTQYIAHSNAITIKHPHTSANPFTFKDVTQTGTLSNSGVIDGELVQYIIHINGLTHNSRETNFAEKMVVNGADDSITVNGPASAVHRTRSHSVGSATNVFKDVNQTSTLSNSGAVTGDLIQYIIHINGMNTDKLRNIADSAGSDIISQLLRKIVDKMSINGICDPEKP